MMRSSEVGKFRFGIYGWLNISVGSENHLNEILPSARWLRMQQKKEPKYRSYFCVLLQEQSLLKHYPTKEMCFEELESMGIGPWRNDDIELTFRSRWGQGISGPPPLPEVDENIELMEASSLRCPKVLGIVLSNSSYERTKSRHRGSAPNSPVLGPRSAETPSPTTRRFTSIFSKRTPKVPLKRTKSVSKLDRKRGAMDGNRQVHRKLLFIPPSGLRTSRSHESLLLSNPGIISDIDLSQCVVKPLSGHYCGQEQCFELCSREGVIRHYSCSSEEERNSWVQRLRESILKQNSNIRRVDNSLIIWILEAKGLPQKKKYYCELCLGQELYNRTSTKQIMADMCFWGEHFEFNQLEKIESVIVNLYRESETKKRRNKLIGSLEIPIEVISGKHLTESRYKVRLEKNSGIKDPPSIRIKARFQSVNILPFDMYKDFREFLCSKNKPLTEMLEPVQVLVKEDIAVILVRIMQKENKAKEFLTNIVIEDVKKIDDQHLTFRGNSFATKASEAYMKLLGDKYLQDTLKDFITNILSFEDDCEVDTSKVPNESILQQQQKNLLRFVEEAWDKIIRSSPNLPLEFKEVFCEYRNQLKAIQKEHICDKLISSSIFLRFLCPAILYPSLFNLTQEYPEPRSARNLTLIAKTIQTLANFTRFGEKEQFMEFLNQFVDKQQDKMRNFLQQISTPDKGEKQNINEQIDLGKELSILHSQLIDCIPKMNKLDHEEDFNELQQILNYISSAMRQSSAVQHTSSQSLSNINRSIHSPLGLTKSLPEGTDQMQHQSLVYSPTCSLCPSINSKDKKLKMNGDLELTNESSQKVTSPHVSPDEATTTTWKYRGSKIPAENMNTLDDYVKVEALLENRKYSGEKQKSTFFNGQKGDKHFSSPLVPNGNILMHRTLDRNIASEQKTDKERHRSFDFDSAVPFIRSPQAIDASHPLKTENKPSEIVLNKNVRNSDYDKLGHESNLHTKPGSHNSICKISTLGSSGYHSVGNDQSLPSPDLSHVRMTFSSEGQYTLRPPLAFKNPLYCLDHSRSSSSSESDFCDESRREEHYSSKDDAICNSHSSFYPQNETGYFSSFGQCNNSPYHSYSSLSDSDTTASQTYSPLPNLLCSIQSGSLSKLSEPQYQLPHSCPISNDANQQKLERQELSEFLIHGERRKDEENPNQSCYTSSCDSKRQRSLREASS
ncbi:ras GTPase-activating protein raskol-like isoform X4 [Tachypleus tridentatus]|uniref:ras GTPase-activating protein raskol-like isoform X4 n=1 Tax=Tachypleus tridentatus TaxID=6853 RepID=UPI003FD45593